MTSTAEVTRVLGLDNNRSTDRLAKELKGPIGSGHFRDWTPGEIRWARAASALRDATGLSWRDAVARTQVVTLHPEATYLFLVNGRDLVFTVSDVEALIGLYKDLGDLCTVVRLA